MYLSISFTAIKPAPHMSEEISSLFGYILWSAVICFHLQLLLAMTERTLKEFLATGLKSSAQVKFFSILSARLQHPPLTVQAFSQSHVNLEAYLQDKKSVFPLPRDKSWNRRNILNNHESKNIKETRAPLIILRKAQVCLHPWYYLNKLLENGFCFYYDGV